MYSLGWWILVVFTFAIGIWSIRLYFKDKDKRKLMFSIIFFLSILIFIMNALKILTLFQNNIFLENLFQWSTLPIMTAIFISVVESFSNSRNFDQGFLLFIGFSIISFGLVFISFPIEGFLAYVRIIIASGVIFFSLYQLLKWKNIQSGFFLISMSSFSVAGIAHAFNQFGLSIFAYFIAYLFLVLVFAWYSSNKPMKKIGMGSYFSLQKQLDHTQSQLQQNKELYKSIVENMQDVIILTKSNGLSTYASPSSSKVLGFTPEELIHSHTWPIRIHPEDEQKVQDAMKKGYMGYPGSNLEYRIYNKKGDIRWISHSWTPVVKNGKLEVIVSSIKDITDLKKTQEKLADRIEHLRKNELATLNIMEDFQDSIASLKKARKQIDKKNAQLQESQRQLKQLNEGLEHRVEKRTEEVERLLNQKDAFIDQLGHDLKHPLGPLINLLPLLQKRENDEKKKEILTVLERNVSYMKQLVIRTVRLAKLNAPSTTFDFQYIAFADFIQKIIEKNSTLFKEFDVDIITKISSDIKINADPLQIEEVIDNLISNAVKYGAKHGQILITTLPCPDKEHVEIIVTDTGYGMTSEQLDYVFNEFYKADGSRHDFSSTGLGLSICKRIIEKHNGSIWAESDGIGKGTSIHFTLPIVGEENDPESIYIHLNKNNN